MVDGGRSVVVETSGRESKVTMTDYYSIMASSDEPPRLGPKHRGEGMYSRYGLDGVGVW